MKLEFRILEIPTDKCYQAKPGHNNIPLLDPTGFLWFLWRGPAIKQYHKQYILKKLT